MIQATQKTDIGSLYLDELTALVKSLGEQPFRAGQIFGWLHREQVTDFSQMTNLSKELRQKLSVHCFLPAVGEKRRQTATDGTIKLLFALHDQNTVEAVLMRHEYGNSLCISTQVGCRMGCKFCASTLAGRVRDLSAYEMLSQVYQTTKLTGSRVDSIVLMGIGEPLDNFDNVVRFLELIRDEKGRNLSHRHISLSTCGVVPNIYELAKKQYQLTLSVSLHAPDNATRSQIMPVNQAYSVEQLMQACRDYFDITHRRISYEYALIAGVNDKLSDADRLAALLSGQGCHINLIPVNPVAETGFSKTSKKDAAAFRDRLIAKGFSCTIRRELGTQIDAACGQLRRSDSGNE